MYYPGSLGQHAKISLIFTVVHEENENVNIKLTNYVELTANSQSLQYTCTYMKSKYKLDSTWYHLWMSVLLVFYVSVCIFLGGGEGKGVKNERY